MLTLVLFSSPSLLHPDTHLWRQFSCCCCQYTPWWCLSAPSLPNCLPGLHFIQATAKFCHKTLQHQLRLVLCFRSRTNKQHSCIKIIIWHDVVNNSLTPHFCNFNRPLCPTAIIQKLSALPCDLAAIVYCQCTGSPDVLSYCVSRFL